MGSARHTERPRNPVAISMPSSWPDARSCFRHEFRSATRWRLRFRAKSSAQLRIHFKLGSTKRCSGDSRRYRSRRCRRYRRSLPGVLFCLPDKEKNIQKNDSRKLARQVRIAPTRESDISEESSGEELARGERKFLVRPELLSATECGRTSRALGGWVAVKFEVCKGRL